MESVTERLKTFAFETDGYGGNIFSTVNCLRLLTRSTLLISLQAGFFIELFIPYLALADI